MPDLLTTDVDVAVDRLRDGGLVAIPTETVYGLGASADLEDAVRRVFQVKGRPTDHPLIVHVASLDHLDGWTAPLPSTARVLAEACWPGPLTLLVPRGVRATDTVTGGRPTIGVRVPAHPLTLDVLRRLDGGVAAPSANRFGRVSPTTARHVLDDIGALLRPGLDAVLDGGACPVGVESTIVDCTTEPPQVLRPGGITAEQITRLLDLELAPASGPSRAAGMLASHYAPRCTVELASTAELARHRRDELTAHGRRADVLDRSADLVAYARELYNDLRLADERGLDVLVAVLPPAEGLGHAIRDRLTKAATPTVTDPADPSPDG